MDINFLEEIGLTTTQAKAYLTLLGFGELSPPQLAEKIGESRTNSYMVLDKLTELGLARKARGTKKLVYVPENPSALEAILEQKKQQTTQTEIKLRESLPQLLTYFNSRQELPSVKFYRGKDELIKLYEDHLRSKQDSYYLRTQKDVKVINQEIIRKYLHKRAKLGISSYGVAPDTKEITEWEKSNKKQLNLDVKYIPAKEYTAPVEISTYGNKTVFISFGEEAVGVLIDSPNIAQAVRQVLTILRKDHTVQ